MKYIDLHCDALTKEGVAVVSRESLRAGGCALQCFAAFVDGGKGEGTARAVSLCGKFNEMCAREGLRPAAGDPAAGEALLTVEGGEAVGGELENLAVLYALGVRMLGLTWNYPNAIGGCATPYPPLPPYKGGRQVRCPSPLARRNALVKSPSPLAGRGTQGEGRYGLTPFGRACVERMCEMGMIADVSHGSDRLVSDVAEICKKRGVPFVASHSNARAVFPHPRNLADEGIRAVAESGGVVGLCFVEKFLSADGSAEGQREAMLAHLRHMMRVGGEDVSAIGSDFDGAPANAYIGSPADMPKLLFLLERTFGARIAEKIAYTNALRALRLGRG